MKFSQLEIGRVFDYQDNRYSKSGPLQAKDIASGKERTIPRAASVQPVDTATPGMRESEQTLRAQLEHLRTQLDSYHQSALSTTDSRDQEMRRGKLESGYHDLVEAIDQISQQIFSG